MRPSTTLPSRLHGMSCAERSSAHLSFGSAGGSGRVGNDAEFIFALPLVGNTCVNTRLPRSYTNFQANVGQGWQHPSVLSSHTPVRPSPSHTYEFALVGVGESVSFRVLDPDTRDDYGSFHGYLRNATTGDCAGRGHSAFGLSANACLAATATSPGPPRLPAVPKVVALDQAPLAKVLRSSDVSAVNQEAPSGALTASQFATLDNGSRSAARAEKRLLESNGFSRGGDQSVRQRGIAEPQVHSGEAGSPQRALVALQQEVALAARTQAPAGATVSTGRDTHLPQGYVLTFAATAGGVGGLELLASAGKYLYTLRAVANSGSVALLAEEQLLRRCPRARLKKKARRPPGHRFGPSSRWISGGCRPDRVQTGGCAGVGMRSASSIQCRCAPRIGPRVWSGGDLSAERGRDAFAHGLVADSVCGLDGP